MAAKGRMREPTGLEPNSLEECVSRPHRPKCQVRASALKRYIGFSFVSDGKLGGLEKIGKGEKTDRIPNRNDSAKPQAITMF